MDWDDCPDCLGTGYIEIPEDDTPQHEEPEQQ